MAINKIMDPNVAARAYTNTSGLNTIGGGGGSAFATNTTESFSDFLDNAARTAVETMRAGEKMSAKAVTGEAELTEVVEAVTAAEVTLQSVVSIRDKLVGAYQEIIRMAI